jgi:hypothetical protein
LRLAVRIKVWLLGPHSNTHSVPAMRRKAI